MENATILHKNCETDKGWFKAQKVFLGLHVNINVVLQVLGSVIDSDDSCFNLREKLR